MSSDKHFSDSISCQVTSKYFTSKTGMDESLLDFQEKKQFTGPKANLKPSANKPKTKKVPKRPRGQKDIRTVLRSKKNELASYTKHFDTVCKQSGIDVDSEQLHLAVALSKSLQPLEDYTETTQSSLQERTVRIRTTLQEYGFTVPEIKNKNLNKKNKKHRKDYKLLSVTEAEKQQIIIDKYSQVLFQNLDCSKFSPNKKKECRNINAKLYYISTDAAYNLIKNNDSFYVNDLPLEKSLNKTCLLRDWSEIPGRPVSPKLCKDFTMDISEIDCSQDELDVILSGTLKCAKKITKFKIKEVHGVHCNIVNNNAKHGSHMNLDINVENNADDKDKSGTVMENIGKISSDSNLEDAEEIKSQIEYQGSKLKTSEIVRSHSPDLFDDEPPSMFINSKDIIQSPQNVSIPKLHSLDLQEVSVVCEEKCGNIYEILPNSSEVFSSVESENTDNLKLSQSNVTKRRSNDIMEITECISTCVHLPLLHENKSCSDVDATKSKTNDFMDLTECVPLVHKEVEYADINIDLTQKSDDEIDLTIVQQEPETILTEKSFRRNSESMDLTQSSNSVDDLPFIQVSGTNQTSEETVILNDSDCNTINRLPTKCTLDKEVIIINEKNDVILLDLIEESTPKSSNKNITSASSNSSFDEFIYDHSDNVGDKDTVTVENNTAPPRKDERKSEIDLTQSTNSSEEVHERSDNSLTGIPNNDTEFCNKSNLGKIDNESIDYDEVISNMNQNMSYSNNETANSDSNLMIDTNKKQMETSIQLSDECEVFEISDKELDYSLHKSRFEQPEINFGGISIMDDISHVQIFDSNKTESNHNFKRSSVNPSSPVNIKFSNINRPMNCEIATPTKETDIYATVKTPNNKEYLMKTDEVTPMLDFASMSTPERNQELDKYGLKPLKRKRAIQLLTHIYNQTHPILETCSNNELQSLSKKQKREPTIYKPQKQIKSPRKSGYNQTHPILETCCNDELQSPSKKQKGEPAISKTQKQNKSPRKSGAENIYGVRENIYETTNETVVVRDIECSADDWVFQKREKAKVHSCRVPLHIAFHNYVSCHRWLREAILRYEPVNIDVIHKDLTTNGFKYDPKDLLKFLDKKCITVKTTDNSSRNSRR